MNEKKYSEEFQTGNLEELLNYDVIDDEMKISIDEFDISSIPSEDSASKDGSSFITKGTVIDGNIKSDSTIALNGRVNGNIETSKDIGIGGLVSGNVQGSNVHLQNAKMRGDINCQGTVIVSDGSVLVGKIKSKAVVINSKVKGTINAENTIDIKDSAVVVGDIVTSAIHMSEVARVDAKITLFNKSVEKVDEKEFMFDLGE